MQKNFFIFIVTCIYRLAYLQSQLERGVSTVFARKLTDYEFSDVVEHPIQEDFHVLVQYFQKLKKIS